MLELNEFSLYHAERTFRSLSSIPIVPCLGSVQDSELLKHLLHDHKINTVYHTAAYKHVPLVEENPLQGLRNNALGTQSLIEKCIEAEVNSFVLISTDKAVRPTNVMGASKRIAEMIVQDAARRFPESKIGIVRFGNVLDSSGSVVPLFREQIKKRHADYRDSSGNHALFYEYRRSRPPRHSGRCHVKKRRSFSAGYGQSLSESVTLLADD